MADGHLLGAHARAEALSECWEHLLVQAIHVAEGLACCVDIQVVAARQRYVQARRDVAVELDLAAVDARRHTTAAAECIVGLILCDKRGRRTGGIAGVIDGQPRARGGPVRLGTVVIEVVRRMGVLM